MSRKELLDLAATIAVGGRPSGGPYVLTITDGARWKHPAEYEVNVLLHEWVETESEKEHLKVLMEEKVLAEEWSKVIRESLDNTKGITG